MLSPMLIPRRSFATKRTGRSGAKTSACVESVEFFDCRADSTYERRCQTEDDCGVKQSLASQHVGKLACSIASKDLTYRASSVPFFNVSPDVHPYVRPDLPQRLPQGWDDELVSLRIVMAVVFSEFRESDSYAAEPIVKSPAKHKKHRVQSPDAEAFVCFDGCP